MSEPFFAIRPYRAETDADFVHGAWLRSNRFSPRVRGMTTGIYEGEWKPLIAGIVARCCVMIAHAPTNEDAMLGFACYSFSAQDARHIVHQVYVKRDARKLGVATALLGDLLKHPAVYTCFPVVRGTLPIPESWVYNPEAICRY